jgi:type VI protein secretion system component VasK
MVYTGGSEAPVLEPVPEPERPLSRSERERIASRRKSASRNQQRALMFNPSYLVVLAIATMLLALFCGIYVKNRVELTSHMREVTSLQGEIEKLRASNDALEKQLGVAINLNEIRDAAEDYGMSYPDEDQIRYYSIEDEDYLTQFAQ